MRGILDGFALAIGGMQYGKKCFSNVGKCTA
jgi:hypothetical protein